MIVLFLCLMLFFSSCSTNKEKDWDEIGRRPRSVSCCTQQKLHHVDSIAVTDSLTSQTRTRSQLEAITLLSFGKNYENDNSNSDDYTQLTFPVHHAYGNDYTDICFKTDFDTQTLVTIDAINEYGTSVPVSFPFQDWFSLFKTRPCFFCSTNSNEVSLTPGSVKTPNGSSTLSPLYSPVYRSDEYRFGFLMFPERIYYKTAGTTSIVSPDQHLELSLKECSSLFKAQIILTDMSFPVELHDQINYTLLRDEFRLALGELSDWSISVFVDGVPQKFSVAPSRKLPEGDNILALGDCIGLQSGLKYAEKKGRKTYQYLGVGLNSWARGRIFPFKTKDSYLKYSFRYEGDRPFLYRQVTLRVKIKDLDLEQGTEYLLRTIIDAQDLRDILEGKEKPSRNSSSRYIITQNNQYGVEVEIPYSQTIEQVTK